MFSVILISKFFNAFYINDLLIEGSKSILKVRANDNGNPQYTRTVEMQLTWPDETVATRNGVKVKEWIEGFDTRFPSDNVYEITGNWTTTFRNGNTYSHSIQTPLRRAFVCRFIVSGTVRIDRSNVGGLMDFGDGSCDNLATFTTDDGEVIEITLRR